MTTPKLALHVHQPSPDVDTAIRSAPWAAVKSLNSTQPLATARDAGIPIRILRLYGVEWLTAPQAIARWRSVDLTTATHLQLCCEEPEGYDPTWQLAVIDGLSAAGYSGRYLVGGFATGNPTQIVTTATGPHFPELEAIYPLLRRPDVDLALDAYSGILPDDPRWAAWAPYTSQRHRLIVADLARQGIAVRVAITESGGDNAQPVPFGNGWRTRGWSADQYLSLLTTLDQGDQADAAVLCRCVFTLNATPDWAAYEIEPIVPAIAQYVKNHTFENGASAAKGTPVASLPIPLESQLTSDGPNKYNECGPTCIRMVCDYLGVDPGETIDGIDADETGDASLIGYTTTNEMVAWFAAHGIAAVQSQPQDMAAAIAGNLARGWPCIYLGVWDRQALTGGHFEAPVADTGDGITFNNPYGGFVETLSYADVNRYSLGWLVTIQEAKEAGMDPTLQAAAVARFSALGVQPNTAGALFKAYARMVAAWLANGQDGVLDPTPAIKPEAATPDGQHAYLLLDSGRVLHWRKDTGLVYQAEYKELPAIFQSLAWGQAA